MHHLHKISLGIFLAAQLPFILEAQTKINHYDQGKQTVESFVHLIIAKAKKDGLAIMQAMRMHSTVQYPKTYTSFQGRRFKKGITDTINALSIEKFKRKIEQARLTKQQKIEAFTEYFILKTLGLQKYAHLFFTQEKPSVNLKNTCRKKALNALKKPKQTYYKPVSDEQLCSCSVSDDSCSASCSSCSCSCDEDYEYVFPYYSPFPYTPVIV